MSFILFLALIVISSVNCQDDGGRRCFLTGYGGPSVGDPCVFPFFFGGRDYHACTDATDPDGRHWCSTK